MKKIIFLLLISLQFLSCTKIDVFEKTVPIPGQSWVYSNKPSFTFNITDTTSGYDIFIVLRHTDAYKYNNIWLNVSTQFPGDTIRSQYFDLTLGTDAKGWEGNGMDDIFEVRKIITPGPVFKKPGNYSFTISQIMRENPLQHILNIGVRVEKVKM